MLEYVASAVSLCLQIVLTILVVYFLVIVYFHFKSVSRQNYYMGQGVVQFPGSKRFLFGNHIDLIDYGRARGAEEPIPGA